MSLIRSAAMGTGQSTREALLEAVIQSALDCIVAVDERGRVVEFNPAAVRTFGYEREAAIGRPVAELIVPERHRAAHLHGFQRLVSTRAPTLLGARVEIEALCADGREIPVELTLAEVEADGRRLFTASIRDLSQQRESEQALRTSEARLKGFMHHAPVGMYLKDADGRYMMANPEMSRVFGRPIDQVIGKHPEELFSAEDAAMIAANDAALRASGKPSAVEEFLADRTDYEWTLVVRFPVNRDGEAEIGGFDIDITSVKQSEEALRRSQDALLQAEKLSALGSLLAGVSHELNNPLAVIIGQAVMLEEDLAGHPSQARASSVRLAADRCAGIVQTFLSMARQRPAVRETLDLNALIAEALELAKYGLRVAGVEIDLRLAAAPLHISADGSQLHQALLNLFLNAQQAMEAQTPSPRLVITTFARGGQAIVEIADNGPGISAALARRIFEPFFTTRPAASGTGLGLAFARGVAEGHGGSLVLADSDVGACFRLSLPQADPSGSHDQAPVRVDIAPLRILIIEDEAEVAATLRALLAREGHQVRIAPSVAQARRLVGETPFDAVLSDVRMPGEDGFAFHAWLREHRPDLARRTIFVTGDTLGARVQQLLTASGQAVIEKPFTPASLRAALAGLTP